MSKTDKAQKAPIIKVRMVWRLVLSLFLHLTLLLFLAIYLEVALYSIRSYAPAANADQIELESLGIVPALLGAMDVERRAYQKDRDARDLDHYTQTRETVLANLKALNSPLLLASPAETQRRALARQWITEVGDVAISQPMALKVSPHNLPVATGPDSLDAHSRELLDRLNVVSGQVRQEVQTLLTGLQNQEAVDANGLVNLMWCGVGFVSVTTIIFQLLVANSIIGPIQSLAGAVRRMQRGDYTARTVIRSGDEIQGLSDTFNDMAESIQRNQMELEDKNARLSSQQEALRNVNATLEQRVAEKTGELEDKNQKLNQAARLKDEFLATLSHELRTPLTPVISSAHLLATDPALDPTQLRSVQLIDRNARALSRMIDELLDLSAVMNRKLRLMPERTEMNEWTRATLETMRPVWEKKLLTLSYIPELQPVEVEIDPTRLAQVITNLITNAVKYTDPNGKISVQLTSSDTEVRIAVADTGAGLTREEIQQIFEMFHQARTPQTQNVGGLGVGLTVARSLAELHGGGLLAESPGPGQGATFTLWLPRQPVPVEAGPIAVIPAATSSTADRELLRGRRVLLVEDSDDTREALERIFQRRECQVSSASSGEEALEVALREPPEIIVSDLGLPGISGFDLMRQLRARPGFDRVVAIALSGLGRDQDIQGAAEAGFDTHLLKPVDIAVLDQTLAGLLRKKQLDASH